jgi:hypothetical protein
MAQPAGPRYVDHPAPSVAAVTLLLVAAIVLAAALVSAAPQGLLAAIVMFVSLGVVSFYFWPFYTTYYTLSPDGLVVRYGPWTRRYPWSDFSAAYWQKGMFAMRIGWPSITPCVRLTNAVLLRRRKKWRYGLYLTPNDPRAFLQKISEVAPELTAETIL